MFFELGCSCLLLILDCLFTGTAEEKAVHRFDQIECFPLHAARCADFIDDVVHTVVDLLFGSHLGLEARFLHDLGDSLDGNQ